MAGTSRFRIGGAPQTLPGNCAFCGTADTSKRYVDFGRDFEFYGTLYGCEACVHDLAAQFGFADPTIVEAANSRADAAEAEVILLRSRLRLSEEYVASLHGLGVSPSVSVTTGDSGSLDSLTASRQSAAASGVKGTSESSDESGPDDLRQPASDLGVILGL